MTAPIDRLEDAIRDYIASDDSNDGEILTEWVVLACVYPPEDAGTSRSYYTIRPRTQGHHSTVGLIETARSQIQSEEVVTMWLGVATEEDDD